jgi:Fe-S oxidoreductase
LDYCCGDSSFFLGDIDKGSKCAEDLVAAFSGFQPETVILWCPTCQCRFDRTITPAMDVPFQLLSFPQYVAGNMDKLRLSDAAAGTVTLHEPCKSAYTGVDREGARQVLCRLPGVTLREMKHHGEETMCCGSGAISWFPESCARLREDRLKEADQTGVERLVTVCHYCSQTFASELFHYGFDMTNYVNLVAEAMGIQRLDKFKTYACWKDLDRILEDADPFIRESPFDKERIIEVLQKVFCPQK